MYKWIYQYLENKTAKVISPRANLQGVDPGARNPITNTIPVFWWYQREHVQESPSFHHTLYTDDLALWSSEACSKPSHRWAAGQSTKERRHGICLPGPGTWTKWPCTDPRNLFSTPWEANESDLKKRPSTPAVCNLFLNMLLQRGQLQDNLILTKSSICKIKPFIAETVRTTLVQGQFLYK